MATKTQMATEILGLWEGKRGALYVLDTAEKAVCSAVEKGDKDFSLLAYLQTQSNTMFKILVEGARISTQELSEEQQAEVERLGRIVKENENFLQDFDNLHEIAIVKAVKEKNLSEILALWKDMPTRVQTEIDDALNNISGLRLVNMQKGNAHVAQSYQKRKVSSGSNGNSHNLPKLHIGQEYSITRSGQILNLKWDGVNDWIFSDNGKNVATSKKFPKLSITSWTMVGRIMRVLQADYTPKDNEYTVKAGDLGHKCLGKVKAGGIKPLSVSIVE